MALNEKQVMEFVEKELKANPDASTSALFENAKAVDSGVKALTLRQFNARFPLQVKRKKSMEAPSRPSRRTTRRRRTKAAAAPDRDRVRQVFLRFASDVASAEERRDLVKVLAGVDGYVDEVLKGANKK